MQMFAKLTFVVRPGTAAAACAPRYPPPPPQSSGGPVAIGAAADRAHAAVHRDARGRTPPHVSVPESGREVSVARAGFPVQQLMLAYEGVAQCVTRLSINAPMVTAAASRS